MERDGRCIEEETRARPIERSNREVKRKGKSGYARRGGTKGDEREGVGGGGGWVCREARKAAGKEKYPRVVNSNDIRVGSWLAARMRWMARRMQIWLVGVQTDGRTDRRTDGRMDRRRVASAKGTRRGGASTCTVQPYRRLYAAVPLLGCSQSGGTGRSDADRRVAAGLSPAAFSEGWISAMLDARRVPSRSRRRPATTSSYE